ncbi:hypothetical protein M5K25_013022 [Dendrobium thyrsiflorum]|uniref:Uncharacterized protein n=1 Tax=Dendrobium thyrsiflorum TaxID=117978 RepID=A0ABD0UY98_DENTH
MGCFVQGYLVDRGFDAIGEHTGDDHDRNIMVPFCGKPSGSEGPGRDRLPTVPFDGKTIGPLFCSSLLQFTENFGSLPASPPLGGNFRSHSLPTTESRVWGLQVYLSERGAVVSPQAGTYEYPFLAVGAAPVSHPTALEKSAYRRFAGPSRMPKKKLLDHPLRHKHRDALPPTTSAELRDLAEEAANGRKLPSQRASSRRLLRSKCRNFCTTGRESRRLS